MHTGVDFQIFCGDCGSLAIRIENPESASRETIVYCGDCDAPRGTVGGLRDLAVRPDAHVLPMRQRLRKAQFRSELVALHNELQSLRRKVQIAESRWRTAPPNVVCSNDPGKDESDLGRPNLKN
jgi:hypothetical protein